jgi:CheY-like chemotaxis protein
MVPQRRTPPDTNPDDLPGILFVEDDIIVRMATAQYLRDCGYRVIEANGADEAIEVLKTDTPIDVVFTDVQMPGSLDGFGLAQWVRRERPGLRVIITSGVARTADQAGDLCADGPLLAKPYAPEDLERRIRILLDSRDSDRPD